MGTMEKMPLTEQELHCIARQLQVEKYTPGEKQNWFVHPCKLCRYSFICWPSWGPPHLRPAKHRGVKTSPTDVAGKLTKLTGVNIYGVRKGISLEEVLLQGSWADTMTLEECMKPFEENIIVYKEAMEAIQGRDAVRVQRG